MVYIIHYMKYFLATILLTTLIAPATYAQTPVTTPSTPQGTTFETSTEVSLLNRKTTAVKSLQELSSWLGTVLLRVQLATARLTTNGVNTTEAEIAITAARAALTTAQSELALFIAVPVDNKPETLTALRTHAKNTEEALKNARTQITVSLNALQTTLQTQ